MAQRGTPDGTTHPKTTLCFSTTFPISTRYGSLFGPGLFGMGNSGSKELLMMLALAQLKETVWSVLRTLIPSIVLRQAQQMLISRHRIRSLGVDGRKIPVPQAFYFEVRTRCNGACAFCAAAIQAEIREDMSMPFDLYAKVAISSDGTVTNGTVIPSELESLVGK